VKTLAKEYLNSAEKLKQRIDHLKRLVKTKEFDEQKKLEDRIVILTAEYYYLLKTAHQLTCYYDKDKIFNAK